MKRMSIPVLTATVILILAATVLSLSVNTDPGIYISEVCPHNAGSVHDSVGAYHDYILLTSSNGGFAAANVGTITSAVDLGDVTKYMGGLRQTIEYIYSLNPNAIIYVQTVRYQSAIFGTSATEREQIMHVNDEIRNMCRLCSFRLLDSAYDSGFNQYNSTLYSYDGGSHYNHIGSKIMGLSFRKAILGF